MSKKYYKVVSKISQYDNKRFSARAWGDYQIAYFIGCWTPSIPETKIFIFKDLNSAVTFRDKGADEEIWECEAQGVVRIKYYSPINGTLDCFWQCYKNKNYKKLRESIKKYVGERKMTPPEGTLFCDSVKLIKRVG